MKLFKIILFFFFLYFIRRFIHLLKAIKKLQAERDFQMNEWQKAQSQKPYMQGQIFETDFKIVQDEKNQPHT